MTAKLSDFFTRAAQEEGKVVLLSLPDGTPTEHWIKIVGVDSTRFQAANMQYMKKIRDLVELDSQDKRDEESRKLLTELQSYLITDWSFPEKCDKENVTNFLREAPQIASMVDKLSANRKFFLTKSTSDSSNLRSTTSRSAKSRKGQK